MFDDIPRPGLWKRLLIGALPVHLRRGRARRPSRRSTRWTRSSSALEQSPELKLGKDALADTDPGQPQTLLILGSDRRPKNNVEGGSGARSDTIMLVRLDPDKEATAIMSLPRDLKVQIPGHGMDKINAAYELGGPQAHARDGQAAHRPADQPRDQRDLQGLLARGERDRLRVHGRRPRLLQRQPPSSRTSTSTRATSACARARRSSTCATATRTPTSSARPASRTSCAR